MIYEFANQSHTVIRAIDVDHVTIYDEGREGWADAVSQKPAPYAKPAEPDPLAIERAGMQCTMLQARLALGADLCAELDALAGSDDQIWALRQTLTYATTFTRNSQGVDELAYALDLSATDVDDLFRKAMAI